MPQAALPDINTILITYRREIIVDLNHKNYSGVVGSLMAINAVLPDKYQVEISTRKYNEHVNQSRLAKCGYCNYEPELKTLKIENVLLDSFNELIRNTKNDKVWKCEKCKKMNRMSKTKIIQPKPKMPFFIGIVPEPPERADGMMDRMSYSKKFTAWARNFLVELEHQMGKYRIEYVPKSGDEEENIGDNGGEEFEN